MRVFQITYKESPRYKGTAYDKLIELNYPIEIVEGFFGDNFENGPLSLLTRTKGVDANYNLSLREIALSCGHMKVWRKVLDENLEYALIVEDDSWPLHDYEYLVKTHKELFKDIDYDVIQLHHPHQSYNCSDSSAKWTKHPTLNIEKANPCGFGTIGYIVSQRGAKRLMYETKIQPSDWIIKSISRQHDSTYNTVEDFFEHEKVHPSTIRYCDNSKIFGVGSQKTGTSN